MSLSRIINICIDAGLDPVQRSDGALDAGDYRIWHTNSGTFISPGPPFDSPEPVDIAVDLFSVLTKGDPLKTKASK